MKKLLTKLSKKDKQLILNAIKYYLNNRPSFFGLIRAQELFLFYYFRKYLNGNILDFGHGDGFFADFLVKSINREITIGLDLENSRINESLKIKSCEKAIIYDGNHIPFKNNYFQSVMSNCVLEHLDNLEDSLKEINRVLKPGGFFCTTVMTDHWEKYLLGKKIFGQKYLDYLAHKQKHVNLLSTTQWTKVFKQNNFELIKEVPYLNEKNVKWLELFHYLSVPSLFSKKIVNRWVLIKNGFKTKFLSKFFYNIVEESLFTDKKNSSAIFYVLMKKNKKYL